MSMTDSSQPMVLHLHDFDTCPALLEDVREMRPRDLFISVGDPAASSGPVLSPARNRMFSSGDNGLVRLLKHLDSRSARVGCIHAWGMRSTSMLLRAPEGIRLISTIDGYRSDVPEAKTVATVLRTGRVDSLLGSCATQRAVADCLGDVVRRTGQEQVVCPVLDPDRIACRDDDLRARWGAESGSLVMGVVGRPMNTLNLMDQCGLAVRCSLLGRHVVMLVSSNAQRRGDLVRWLEDACPEVQLVFDDVIERTHEVASSLDVAIAPAAVGYRTRICDVGPIMTMLAAGRPVILGDGHPAAEYADREDLLRIGQSHDQHESTRWLMDRLDSGSGQAERDRAKRRYEHFCTVLLSSYPQAMEGACHDSSGSSRSMAAS